MAKQKQSVRRRTTIGLLTGYIRESGYQASGWRGVAQAAAEHDANLICFVGGGLNMESSYSPGRNLAFQLANAQNTDGLVIMGGAVGEFIGPKALFRFCQRYAPLPIVSVAMSLPGIPSLLVDNVGAMRQALVHLIEVHGRRRLAFVRGPQTNPEAEERYLAYQNTLAAYGLPFDPNLVAPGDFTLASGVAAVRLFLDERRVRLDAIVAANDDTAFGVLSALQQRGLRVPEEVSVVGFDDVPEAAFTLPPLTTVRQPLYEQGKVATEILFARLAGVRIFFIGILPSFPLFMFLYGFFGGWDIATLAELKDATTLTGSLRSLTYWGIYAPTALGARLSPWHGKFPISNRAAAMAEAAQLTAEKVRL